MNQNTIGFVLTNVFADIGLVGDFIIFNFIDSYLPNIILEGFNVGI